jgi:serine/threonine protein kinase
MALKKGTRLGHYEILTLVGAGGMGEVYRARDTLLGRQVAIKVLPPGLAGDQQRQQRFEREARAISRLSHPHICTLHDLVRHDATDFLVMEYLEGETLAARISRGALPRKELLRYAVEIADALAAAHAGGVLHRDLKPSNIMLTKSGIKLLDFGLAKMPEPEGVASGGLAVTATEDLTLPGIVLGTLPYMPPAVRSENHSLLANRVK